MPKTNFSILVLPGDHVGPEVMTEALKVLSLIQSLTPATFDLTHDLCGGSSIDAHGVPVTPAVVALAKKADAVLFGSAGGPKWGTGKIRPEDGLLTLRKELDTFANMRPCKFYSKSLVHLSVLKEESVRGTDFMLIRENCGGAYYGPKTDEADFASDLWAYTRPEIERVAHVGAALAKQHDPPLQVISSDKANVLASSRLWRRVVTETFERDYPDLKLTHQLADSAAMIMMKNPRSFNGVIICDNTFGDILSDEAAVIPGSLGLLPSASLSGIPGHSGIKGIYEPIHGSAPDIAGQGIVNPMAQILSVAMLLRYSCQMTKEADAIEKAVEKVLDSKDIGGLEIRTGDLGGSATTSEVGDAVCKVLKDMLKGDKVNSMNGSA